MSFSLLTGREWTTSELEQLEEKNYEIIAPPVMHTTPCPFYLKRLRSMGFIFSFKKITLNYGRQENIGSSFLSGLSNVTPTHLRKKIEKNKISFNFVFESIPEIMTRSKNPPVRQQAGCSAGQLHPSPLSCAAGSTTAAGP